MQLVVNHTWYFALSVLKTCGGHWRSGPCFLILILKMSHCFGSLASSVGVWLTAARINCVCHPTSLSPPLLTHEIMVTDPCRSCCPCPVQKSEKTSLVVPFLLPDLAFGEKMTWSKAVLLLPRHWLCQHWACQGHCEVCRAGLTLGLEELLGTQGALVSWAPGKACGLLLGSPKH